MRIQLLPSSFGEGQAINQHQRLTTFVVDDRVAIDAGSLAFGCNDLQRTGIRDILISHTHLDHIAGLPVFVDDLFASLETPIVVHATEKMIQSLETHIFNWDIYPKFSQIKNQFGNVLEYQNFEFGKAFHIGHLRIEAIAVNHNSHSAGFFISDAGATVCVTGDTAETASIWERASKIEDLAAVFIECAFPNEMRKLADDSHHLTPDSLALELAKLGSLRPIKVLVSNIKASYRESVVKQLGSLEMPNIEIVEIGKVYEF